MELESVRGYLVASLLIHIHLKHGVAWLQSKQ